MTEMVSCGILFFLVLASLGMTFLTFRRNARLEASLLELGCRIKCELSHDQLEQLHSNAVKVKACRDTLSMIQELASLENDPARTIPDIRMMTERALGLLDSFRAAHL